MDMHVILWNSGFNSDKKNHNGRPRSIVDVAYLLSKPEVAVSLNLACYHLQNPLNKWKEKGISNSLIIDDVDRT